ncbi:hypothetical protein [Nannocystis pusilla]|uniref:hypothetical protein n=1 Tax=Nannocystis pusilla TaxID=889268 RepID=UPI003B808F40
MLVVSLVELVVAVLVVSLLVGSVLVGATLVGSGLVTSPDSDAPVVVALAVVDSPPVCIDPEGL